MVSATKYMEFITLNNKVMKQLEEYEAILDNAETNGLVELTIINPIFAISSMAIGGSIKCWRDLVKDTENYLSALANENDEFINKYVDNASLLSKQIETFIGNYNLMINS